MLPTLTRHPPRITVNFYSTHFQFFSGSKDPPHRHFLLSEPDRTDLHSVQIKRGCSAVSTVPETRAPKRYSTLSKKNCPRNARIQQNIKKPNDHVPQAKAKQLIINPIISGGAGFSLDSISLFLSSFNSYPVFFCHIQIYPVVTFLQVRQN